MSVPHFYAVIPPVAIAGVLLLAGLLRRKRIAWWALTAVLTCSIVVLVKNLADEVSWKSGTAFGVASALLVGVVATQPWFKLHSRWPSVPKTAAAAVLGSFAVAGVAYSTGNDLVVGSVATMAVLVAIFTAARTAQSTNRITATDESALRALIDRSSDADSLAYFTTRRCNSVVFSPWGKAAVAYRVSRRVSVAVGDPVGNPDAWPGAISEWLELCRDQGWTPGVTGASRVGARAYRRAGLKTLRIGTEAILEVAEFDLGSRELKPVRIAVNRLRKQNYLVRVRRQTDLSADARSTVIACATQWIGTQSERGSIRGLGRIGDSADDDALIVEATDDSGARVALMTLVPWTRSGATLDLLVRSDTAPAGITELMISEVVLASAALGITRISLGFNDLADIPADRISHRALIRSKWWLQESARQANAEYAPTWQPRYVAYPSAKAIRRIAIASGRLEAVAAKPNAWAKTTGTRTDIGEGALEALLTSPLPPLRPPLSQAPKRPEQVRARIEKLDDDSYPPAYPPTHSVAEARAAVQGTRVRIAGRLVAWRNLGGLSFGVVRDASGDVQIMVDANKCGVENAERFGKEIDLGDLIELSGAVGRARKGELSIIAMDWRLLGKNLHPLPDRYRGMTNPDTRARLRHVELATNPDVRNLAVARSAVLHSLRTSLAGWNFLEAETPIRQSAGLRTSPALHLKKMCVGGLERVYELGRSFRDQGYSSHDNYGAHHNPEFTQLHAFESHVGYGEVVVRMSELVQFAATAVHGQPLSFRRRNDGVMRPFDIGGEWPVRSFYDAVSEAAGLPVTPTSSAADLRAICVANGLSVRSSWDTGLVAYALYERLVVPRTELPTLYRDFPTSSAPTARSLDHDPDLVQRCDLVIWGTIIGSAHTELTDPIEQRRRLILEQNRAMAGDTAAMRVDDDYLAAMEFGMLPSAGLWIDVDRLLMVITGRTVRETLTFPFVKARV